MQTITTGSYTVSCSRLISDPNTFDWRLGVNDGLQPGGGLNRVQSASGQQYSYDTYRVAPYSNANKWGNTNPTRFSGTLNFGASLTASASGPFDIVMDAGQTVQPAGTYTDTVLATIVGDDPGDPGSGSPGTFVDTFAGPDDDTLDAEWSVIRGSMRVVDGQARNEANLVDHLAVVTELVGARQSAAADFSSFRNAGMRLGIVLRYQDPRNYYAVYRRAERPFPGGGLIMDWLVPEDEVAVGELLREALLAQARADRAQALLAVFPEWTPWNARFQEWGFRLHTTQYLLIGIVQDPRYDTWWLRENWWYQLAELDVV